MLHTVAEAASINEFPITYTRTIKSRRSLFLAWGYSQGKVLGVLGAGVLGAGVLGAGVLGAGVLGAGVLGCRWQLKVHQFRKFRLHQFV